ncbi:hypothetical protein [Gardnerella vaginalis]|uniref:hypothetical protein n=1 Tax=Gardnerella vaginalis TaxID=2702 RepID=UPI003970F304
MVLWLDVVVLGTNAGRWSWFCGWMWWFGKQMWGSVLGFVFGCGGLVNKRGEVFLVLFSDVVVW